MENMTSQTTTTIIYKEYVFRCKECGKEEVMGADNVRWYIDRGLKLPLRCADCRKKRKAAKAIEYARGIESGIIQFAGEGGVSA